MKTYAALLVGLFFTFALVSCSSARPLPTGSYRLVWNASIDLNVTNYTAYVLTNGAPDFAKGVLSTNWNSFGSTSGTNVFIPTNTPALSLLTVTCTGYGIESTPATPVVYSVPANSSVPSIVP